MIAIRVSGNAREGLQILSGKLDDWTEPITELLSLALADAVAAIDTQGAAVGESWAPMSEWTPIVARAMGSDRSPATLLKATGGLVGSLVPGGPGNVLEAGPASGTAGSALRSPRTGFGVALGQQQGTSRTFHVLQGHGFSETGIPARRFLAWHDSRMDAYLEILARHLDLGDAPASA